MAHRTKINPRLLIVIGFPVIALLIVTIGLRTHQQKEKLTISGAQVIAAAEDKNVAKRISGAEADKMYHEDPATTLILDVRSEGEYYGDGHIKGAELIPVGELQRRYQELLPYRQTKKIIVYCRSGARSRSAANFLAEKGFEVYDLGAIMNWRSTKTPIVYTKGNN